MDFLFPAFFTVSVGLQIMILYFEYGDRTVKKAKGTTGNRRHGLLRPLRTEVKLNAIRQQRAFA